MFKCCQVARACSKSFSAVASLGTQPSKGPLACHIAKSQTLTSNSRMRPLTYQASSIFCGHTYVWEFCTKILDDFCGFRAGLRDFAFGMASWWQVLGPFAAGALLISNQAGPSKVPTCTWLMCGSNDACTYLNKNMYAFWTLAKKASKTVAYGVVLLVVHGNSAASTKSTLVRFRPAVGHGRFFWQFLLISHTFAWVSSSYLQKSLAVLFLF